MYVCIYILYIYIYYTYILYIFIHVYIYIYIYIGIIHILVYHLYITYVSFKSQSPISSPKSARAPWASRSSWCVWSPTAAMRAPPFRLQFHRPQVRAVMGVQPNGVLWVSMGLYGFCVGPY